MLSPLDWKRSVFIPIPKQGNAKECSNYRTIALISHASKRDVTPGPYSPGPASEPGQQVGSAGDHLPCWGEVLGPVGIDIAGGGPRNAPRPVILSLCAACGWHRGQAVMDTAGPSGALAGFLTTARPGKPLQPQLEVNGGQTLALDSLCVCSSALGTMVTGRSNPVLIPSLFPPLLHHPSTHIHFAPALSWVLVMVLCGREVSAFHVGRMSTAP